MTGISLLPEELRGKEEQLSAPAAAQPAGSNELRFSAPEAQVDDVEIIEVDEGELDQVLASEPPLSRLAFKLQAFAQNVYVKLRGSEKQQPAPKVPPQFFTPPPRIPGAAPKGAPGAPAVGGKPQAKVGAPAPAAGQQPRRVRVIKRVRKPVNVSFVSNEALYQARADVPRRKFTFAVTFVVFSLLFGASFAYLDSSRRSTRDSLGALQSQVTDVRQRIGGQQKNWKTFKDLEPQLKALNSLLDEHVSPTQLLASIEATTLPHVSYGTLSLTDDGKVTLSVNADSFETAARQVLAYKKASFVKKVDVSAYTATYDEERATSLTPVAVAFQVAITLEKNALSPKERMTTTAYAQ